MTTDAKTLIVSIGLLGPLIASKSGFSVESLHSFIFGAVIANIVRSLIQFIEGKIEPNKLDGSL